MSEYNMVDMPITPIEIDPKNGISPKVLENITFDPNELNKKYEILGIFNNEIHILTTYYEDSEDSKNYEDKEIVLIVPVKEYLRVWGNWIKGKQWYGDRYHSYYSGVMGYTFIKEATVLNKNTVIETDEYDEEIERYKHKEVPMVYVSKFDDHHDFEHG